MPVNPLDALELQQYDLVPPVTTFVLPDEGTNNTTLGVRTGAGRYVLKRYAVPHGAAGLRYQHDLLTWLQGRGLSFAVPAPVATAAGATWLHDGAGYCVLLPLLAGGRPDYRNAAHMESVGAALGELHRALRGYPTAPHPGLSRVVIWPPFNPRIPHPEALTPADLGWPASRSAADLCSWWRVEYRATSRFIRDSYPLLPRQVIHGDFAPSNTLCHRNRVSAILDFEFALPEIRVLDVASGLKYSMRIWERDHPWINGAGFSRGYARFVSLTEREVSALVEVAILRDTVSVIWHYGRALAGGRPPHRERLEEMRDSTTWLKAHRSEVEALPLVALREARVRSEEQAEAAIAAAAEPGGGSWQPRRPGVASRMTMAERRFRLSEDERQAWQRDGFFLRENVFSGEENDLLNTVAEEIVAGARAFPEAHIDRNALVRDGQEQRSGIHGMHKIHFPSCFVAEFLQRVRDPRLTDPIVDLLGPDVLGINNLYIWKAPQVGLGFPWHQDMFYFRQRFVTETTVGTWTAVDAADRGNGCLYVIPGSHRRPIAEHDELAGSQQSEFKLARGTRDEEGVALEAAPGTVIWFHSYLLHKSTDNHSGRFRRSYVSHYLSAQAQWANPERAATGVPVMWVRGATFPGKVREVRHDVLAG